MADNLSRVDQRRRLLLHDAWSVFPVNDVAFKILSKVKVVPYPPGGRRGVAGFYTHHFSGSTALCDGGACLLSVAALP